MIEYIDIDHAQELDAFVQQHEYSHFMQTSLWGRVKRDWGWHGIICRGEDKKICGTMAFLTHKIHHTNTCLLYSPRGPIYDLGDDATFRELINGAKALAKKLKAYRLRFDPRIEAENEDFLKLAAGEGFSRNAASDYSLFQPRMCYVLDLEGKTKESLAAQYHRTTRYNLHHSQGKGVQVRQGDVSELPEFCAMMAMTAEKNEFIPRSQTYFKEFLEGLGEHARLYFATLDGKIIAGAISVFYGNRAWLMYSCSDGAYRKNHPNELLQYVIQCDSMDAGCRYYDFRGVEGYPVDDNPKIGLHRYKQGFGAEFFNYVGQFDFTVRPVMCKLLDFSMKIKR